MNLPASSGDTGPTGSIRGSGRSPRGGSGSPLQYSCLEHPMEPGRLQSIGSKKSRLNNKLRTDDWRSQESLGSSPCHLLEFIPSVQSWQKAANVPDDLSGLPSTWSTLMSPRPLDIRMQVKIKLPSEHTEHLSLSLKRQAKYCCLLMQYCFPPRGAQPSLKRKMLAGPVEMNW